MKRETSSTTSPEFTRFKDLTKRLIAVPKKEIDNKKAKYEHDKTKTKRPAK
jgi:hypothetical protein